MFFGGGFGVSKRKDILSPAPLFWFKIMCCIRKHGRDERNGRQEKGKELGVWVWVGGSLTSLMSCWVLRPRPYQAPVTVMAIDEIVRMDVRICFRVAILVGCWH